MLDRTQAGQAPIHSRVTTMRLMNLYRLILPVAMLAVVLSACGDSLVSSADKRVSESESLTRTTDVAGASELVAETTNGQITLRAIETDVVTVAAFKEVEARERYTADSFLHDVEVTVERRDDQVVVFASYPKPPSNVNVSVQLDITAPADLIARLSHAGDGAVGRGPQPLDRSGHIRVRESQDLRTSRSGG